jgi:hypothetical protein
MKLYLTKKYKNLGIDGIRKPLKAIIRNFYLNNRGLVRKITAVTDS